MSRFQEERKGWVCMHHVRRHAYSVGQSYTEKNPSLSPSSHPPPLLHPDLHIFQDVNGLSMADVDSSHLCRPRGPVNRRKTSHLQQPIPALPSAGRRCWGAGPSQNEDCPCELQSPRGSSRREWISWDLSLPRITFGNLEGRKELMMAEINPHNEIYPPGGIG